MFSPSSISTNRLLTGNLRPAASLTDLLIDGSYTFTYSVPFSRSSPVEACSESRAHKLSVSFSRGKSMVIELITCPFI